jgi:hypothetical protein
MIVHCLRMICTILMVWVFYRFWIKK